MNNRDAMKYAAEHSFAELYQKGREDAIADLFKALPDCDKIEIEHLITIMEQIKEAK